MLFSHSTSYANDQEKLNHIIEYLTLSGYSESIPNGNTKCISTLNKLNPYIDQRLRAAFRKASYKIKQDDLLMLQKRLKNEYSVYVQTVCDTINQQQELSIVAQVYARHVSENEINAILSFAKTEAGQKQIFASQQVNNIGFKNILVAREALINKTASQFSKHVSQTAADFSKGKLTELIKQEEDEE